MNSLIHVSKIQSLESFNPNSIPPEAPVELLKVQLVMDELRVLRVLVVKDSFFVSCMPTMSI